MRYLSRIIAGEDKWRGRIRILNAVLLGVSMILVAWALPAQAQQDAPDSVTPAATDELQRNLQRSAPEREPRILSQGILESGASNTVLELPAVADTYIASGRPSQNFGSDSLFLGYNRFGDSFGAERILLRFDIENNIPANAQIRSAQLHLRLSFSSPADDGNMGTVLRRLASHWSESTVTWNAEPSWTNVDDRTEVGSSTTWYVWDVTPEVAAWVSGTPNHGVEIIGDERVQQRERAFYSRETTTEFFPRLVVDYEISEDNQAPVITVNPLPDIVTRNFLVSWSGEDRGSAGIATYDVQYRVDGGEWIDWLVDVTRTSDEFPDGQNGRRYEFRARGEDRLGNVEEFGSAEAGTTVDTEPPTTVVNPLPDTTADTSFTISWQGDDAGGSGVAAYDVRYRYNRGPWILWQSQTTQTQAFFQTSGDGVYEFEARAVDRLGLVEPFRSMAEASIAVDSEAPFIRPLVWLPISLKDAPTSR